MGWKTRFVIAQVILVGAIATYERGELRSMSMSGFTHFGNAAGSELSTVLLGGAGGGKGQTELSGLSPRQALDALLRGEGHVGPGAAVAWPPVNQASLRFDALMTELSNELAEEFGECEGATQGCAALSRADRAIALCTQLAASSDYMGHAEVFMRHAAQLSALVAANLYRVPTDALQSYVAQGAPRADAVGGALETSAHRLVASTERGYFDGASDDRTLIEGVIVDTWRDLDLRYRLSAYGEELFWPPASAVAAPSLWTEMRTEISFGRWADELRRQVAQVELLDYAVDLELLGRQGRPRDVSSVNDDRYYSRHQLVRSWRVEVEGGRISYPLIVGAEILAFDPLGSIAARQGSAGTVPTGKPANVPLAPDSSGASGGRVGGGGSAPAVVPAVAPAVAPATPVGGGKPTAPAPIGKP